jgi:hypothetical protein
MPNKQRSTTDPMAEDELNDILTEFAFGIIHLQKELEHDKKHHTFTATHGHRDKALAAINAYTTNKIIEELEKFDAMKPETGAYLSDMIADRIAELRKTL